jgi:hypothetical protein
VLHDFVRDVEVELGRRIRVDREASLHLGR